MNKKIKSLLDLGSGRGNMIKKIFDYGYSANIISCDLRKYHDYNVEFISLDLTKIKDLNKIPESELILCLDVLEHIEEIYIEKIIDEFSKKCKHCVLSIANHSDIFENIELHLIQKDETFWTSIIEKKFKIIEFKKYYDDKLMIYILENVI